MSKARRAIEGFLNKLRLGPAARRRFVHRLESSERMPIDLLDAVASARGVSLAAMIVHDQADRVVPYSDGEEVAHALSARLHTTVGLGHRRILSAAPVLAAIVEFLLAGAAKKRFSEALAAGAASSLPAPDSERNRHC
jgi:pimeloyl-ACP methyl ester carboxylesterase